MTFSEFSYPNDAHIIWTLMIVTYPFITGLVAGAFLVSALYFVFNKKELEPIHRFALIVSFSFMVVATLPLQLHLGHPERAFNVVIVPNFTSAISGFGFIYAFYFVILTVEIWLAYRIDIIENYRKAKGFKRTLWSLLALKVYDDSAESIKVDNWYIHILSLIGIPAAFTLHGYVGFMFGSVKSNPWWSSPLMPQIFLISAIQSGVAVIILLYLVLGYIGVLERSYECLKSLIFYLWFAMLLLIISEGLELLFLYYEATDAWAVVSRLLEEKLWYSFVVMQVGIGTVISFTLLTLMVFFQKFERVFAVMAAIVSCLALFEVWMMRWNIVIGGQEFSKSFAGFRSYEPHFLGKEGILSTIILTALPFIVLYIMSRMFSLRPRPKSADKVSPKNSEGKPA